MYRFDLSKRYTNENFFNTLRRFSHFEEKRRILLRVHKPAISRAMWRHGQYSAGHAAHGSLQRRNQYERQFSDTDSRRKCDSLDGQWDEDCHSAEWTIFIRTMLVHVRLRWYNQSGKSEFVNLCIVPQNFIMTKIKTQRASTRCTRAGR